MNPRRPASSKQIPPASVPESRQRQSSDHAQPKADEEMSDNMTAHTGNGLTAEEIAKAVEVTLRNLLVQTPHLLQPNKRSPRRRRAEDLEVVHERAIEPSHHRDFVLVG